MSISKFVEFFFLLLLMVGCLQSEIDVAVFEDEADGPNLIKDEEKPLVESKFNILSSINVNENIGTGKVDLNIFLDKPTPINASIDYNVTSITSESTDHAIVSGTINFNIGEQYKTLSINITDDLIDEFDEVFKVSFYNPSSLNVQTSETNITIIDDDPEPVITISDYTAQPGERAKVSISLDRESEKNLSFQIDSNQSGTAIDGTDYQNITGDIVNIPNNSTNYTYQTKTFYVDVNASSKDYSLIISNPIYSSIGDGTSVIDIVVPNEGTYDFAFSDDGKEITGTSGPYDRAKAIIPLSNGYVYTLNHSQANASIHRYTDEGILDNTFSNNGILTSNWFSGYDQIVDGAAYFNMGLIGISSSRSVEDSFDVFKILPDGSLDNSFSGDGLLEIGLGGYTGGKAIAMDMDRSGKILVGGFIYNTDKDIYLTRINIDGSIDTSFGSSGIVILDILGTNTDDYIHDVKANVDGTIYISGINLTGNSGPSFVARLNENGSLDPSFSTDGVYESSMQVDYSNYSMKSSINVLANRDVIITTPNREASRAYDCQIEKVLNTGSIDTSFGINGYFTSSPGPNIRGCRKTLEDKDGNIVVYSDVASGGFPDAVFVLSPLGIQDMSFNGGSGYKTGMTGTAQGVQFYRGFSMSSDGKLIFAGGFNDIAVTKIWYSENNIPTITITDESFNEGANEHYLLYELSHRVEFPFQVLATTSDISAIAGSDYNALNSFVVENLGRSGGKVNISVIDDGTTEPDEGIEVSLSSTHPHVDVSSVPRILTILNDD